MQLVFVHSTNASSRVYLKQVTDRVVDFCNKFDSDADPNVLFEAVTRSFYDPSPSLLLLAAVNDAGCVVAHLIGSMEEYFGSRYVNVLQFWKDSGVTLPAELKEKAAGALVAWGHANGTDTLRVWARNRWVAEHLKKDYSLVEEERVILSAPLGSIPIPWAERSEAEVESENEQGWRRGYDDDNQHPAGT